MPLVKVLILSLAVMALIVQIIFLTWRGGANFSPQSIVRGVLLTSLLAVSAFMVFTDKMVTKNEVLNLIADMMIICALLLRIWAQLTIYKNWSVGVRIYQNHQLVKTGPYKFLRHPMYVGYAMIAMATIILTQNLSLTICWFFFLCLLFLRAFEESKSLASYFGQEYIDWSGDGYHLFPPVYLLLSLRK